MQIEATPRPRAATCGSARILVGDCRTRLRELPDRSVHAVVTSPPYFGLRDYGVEDQLGLEASPDEYVAGLVDIFREVRRVLRDDGTLWLVLGDCFAGNGGTARGGPGRPAEGTRAYAKWRREWGGLKRKDLVGIPWAVAFALREDGWWLRSDVVWWKRNPVPESVRDRPTRAHEYVFLLAKSERYFFDADAVREPYADATIKRLEQATFDLQTGGPKDGLNPNRSARRALVNLKGRALPPQIEDRPHRTPGRNIRSVWHVATQPFNAAHFATFPTALVEPCIRAGTSARGCCRRCGAPWVRVIERAKHPHRDMEAQRLAAAASTGRRDGHVPGPSGMVDSVRTAGWVPSCRCAAGDTVPATVLDPFSGAGTTALVAGRLGLRSILIELNPDYAAMARERLLAAGIETTIA